MRLIRTLAVGMALVFSAPAFAQMNFDGLESGEKKKKVRKKRTPRKRAAKKERAVEQDVQGDGGEAEAPLPKGGLDLGGASSPAAAPARQTPATPAANAAKNNMQFDSLDVSGKTNERHRMDAAIALFKTKKYEEAALAAYEVLGTPKYAGLHDEAQYLIAKSLYRMGQYHSSLAQFSKILAKGPQSKFFKTSLEWLFFISRKTVNESVILEEIAKYSNFEFPEKFRNEYRYLLARYHFVRGRALDQVGAKQEADRSFDEVKRLTLMIPRKDNFFARAKYLEGLAQFRGGNYQASLESMKEVVRLTRPLTTLKGDEAKNRQSLRELAFMQLARTHYGHRQNRYAIHYYGKVERGNTQWLESLFESAWANYRVGQYEQALGNLITLSSPFFRDEYFPEALILKAVIYYENCRYRESSLILEDFERMYLPVHDQLEIVLRNEGDPSQYYNVLAEIQKKNSEAVARNNTDQILERVLKLALSDKDLKTTNDSILELEGEVEKYGEFGDTFKYSNLSKSLIEDLKVQRESLIRKAGVMAKGKLETELGELKKLLANALRIRFETTTKEKEFLEEQLKMGGKTDIVRNYRYSVAVADDQLYWPYKGEYWRDELGTYQYTLTKGCIEGKNEVGTQQASVR